MVRTLRPAMVDGAARMPIAIFGTSACVVIDARAPEKILWALQKAAVDAEPLDALVEALSTVRRQQVPSFACAIREEGAVRVLLRGDIEVHVTTAGGGSQQQAGTH